MQRQVIALSGISNAGKTTTIGIAYRILAEEGECILAPNPRARKETTAVLEIDGVKVGFTSVGDLPTILEDNLGRLVDAGCMVIVCAAHTRGGTVEAVEHLAPPFVVDWIDKPRESEHEVANRRFANQIVAKVRKAVAEMTVSA